MNIRHIARLAGAAMLYSRHDCGRRSRAVPREPSPAGAEVYIVSPKDGAKVKSPVTVVFGLKGMGIAPAGIKLDNTGHHHLLIDSDLPADMSQPLAAERKERALRQGPDRNHGDAAAGQTHAAARVRRFRCTSRTIRPWSRRRSPSLSRNSR